MKAIPYIIFGICATIYVRYVVRKALNDPPEEERIYSSETAVMLDDEEGWDIEPPEGY